MIGDTIQVLGLAYDELDRVSKIEENKGSILYDLGYTENMAKELCKEYNLLAPLYEYGINRDGCICCPNCRGKEIELYQSIPTTKRILDEMWEYTSEYRRNEIKEIKASGKKMRHAWERYYSEKENEQ